MRRAGRLAAVLLTGLLVASCSIGSRYPEEAMCEDPVASRFLAAQAVPSATLIPCVRAYPTGWRYGGSEALDGIARFWLDSDRAGIHALEVVLTASCTVDGLTNVTATSGELDVQVFLRPVSVSPYVADRHFVFRGGCVTYRYRFAPTDDSPLLAAEVDDALTFLQRSELVVLAKENVGLILCGAEAPPCIGEE